MLHSRKLLYINEIARTGSIRKAAAKLNVASSAINRQIIELEDEIGAELFERLPRGLRLTSAGELYVEHIREVMKSYQRLETRVKALKMPDAGKVRIVTTVGLAAGPMPVLVAKFVAKHPRVKIFMRNDLGSATTLNPVSVGEVDIGIGLNIPASPGIRTLAVFDVPIGAVLPPGHPLTAQPQVSLGELLQERLVLVMKSLSLRDVIDFAFAPRTGHRNQHDRGREAIRACRCRRVPDEPAGHYPRVRARRTRVSAAIGPACQGAADEGLRSRADGARQRRKSFPGVSPCRALVASVEASRTGLCQDRTERGAG